MIVEKNFDVKIKIDSEIVSKYFSQADSAEIDSLLDYIENNCDQDVLRMTVGKYLKRLRESNGEAFNNFVGIGNSELNKSVSVEETKSDLLFDVGDYIFIREITCFVPTSYTYRRYRVACIESGVVVLAVDGSRARKYMCSDIENAIMQGVAYVSRNVKMS